MYIVWWLEHSRESDRPVPEPLIAELSIHFQISLELCQTGHIARYRFAMDISLIHFHICRLFRRADRDRSGGIDKTEFKRLLRGITDDEVEKIYAAMDTNQDGLLELVEIQRVLRVRQTTVSSITLLHW